MGPVVTATQTVGREVVPLEQCIEGIFDALELERTEGTADTPRRVAQSLRELTAGYAEHPAAILGRKFAADSDDMVVLRRIPFQSLCEHHLLPFVGTADVAYIPANGEVVGLSKLARLVDCFARRLQLQERMTHQVAQSLTQHISPHAACIVRAQHFCMGHRGVRKPGAEMITSSMLGAFKHDKGLRAELLGLTC